MKRGSFSECFGNLKIIGDKWEKICYNDINMR